MVSARIAAAMTAVDRRLYLPAEQQHAAEHDEPVPIGYGATCSQPTTVAHMLHLLDPGPGHRVLDVGAGSGWTTALLAHLVSPGGHVLGVELEPDLAERGQANLDAADVVGAQIVPAEPDVLGWPRGAPYDRVLVSAEAEELPGRLVEQVGQDGRMVIPVAGRLLVVEHAGAEVRTRAVGQYRFVPLR